MKKFLKRQFGSNLTESFDYRREVEAEERRKNNEWALGPDCPEIGLRAHALYNYLISEGDIEPLSDEEKNRKKEIEVEIERLNREYDEKEDTDTEILNKIEDLEDEKDSIEDYDVYSIIPDGEYYELTAFRVSKPDLEDRRYSVGDEDEMEDSARENIEDMIKSEGFSIFNKSFVESHIDADKVEDTARDYFSDDVYQNPEVWIHESKRQLSRRQEEEIRIIEMKIEKAEDQISDLEDFESEGYDVRAKIESLEGVIEDLEMEKTEIEENPDGDFPDDLIEQKITELAQDAADDPAYFLRDHGLDYEDFIDEESFIRDAIDSDGAAHFLNSYDGNYDTVRIGDRYYEIMRIE